MAIPFPTAGTTYYTQFTPSSVQAICDAIKSALVTCGWTSEDVTATPVKLTFSGNPLNNETCSIAGLTYTFKTTINNSNAREVLIGASGSDSASNLAAAINAGSGSGTTYSSATSANAACSASAASGVVSITPASGGFGTNSQITVTESLSNVTLSATNSGLSMGRGYKVTMPATPQGLRAAVWLDDFGHATWSRIRVGSADGTLISETNTANTSLTDSGSWFIAASSGRSLEFCGNAHQFFVWMLGEATGTVATKFSMGVPWIRPYHTPGTITGATNASPIVITEVGHSKLTGDDVYISEVGGNTAANGFFTVTKLSADTYSLDGSTGNAAYTSGGISAKNDQISRLIWAMGDYNSSNTIGFRSNIQPSRSGYNVSFWVCVNQFYWGTITSNAHGPMLAVNCGPGLGSAAVNTTNMISNWGSIGDLEEVYLAWPLQSGSGRVFKYGLMWGAFFVGEPIPMDRTKNDFNGYNWICYTDGASESRGGIWLAKSAA